MATRYCVASRSGESGRRVEWSRPRKRWYGCDVHNRGSAPGGRGQGATPGQSGESATTESGLKHSPGRLSWGVLLRGFKGGYVPKSIRRLKQPVGKITFEGCGSPGWGRCGGLPLLPAG